jgi:branched-chain amino acid transport system substrate-binding protein
MKKICIALMISVGLSMFGAMNVSAKNFPLGAFWPMTGPQAYYGRVMSQGAKIAIQQLEEAGGTSGYNIELEITDYKNVDTNLCVTGVRKMIDVDKIPAILASFSATTLAVQPICAKENVVMINGGAYSPMLVSKPYLYTIRMAQQQMLPPMLKFLWDKGIKKIAVIHLSDPAGEVPTNKVIKPLWESWGGEVVAIEPHQPGLTDFTTYVARMRSKKPEAIVDISTGLDQAYIVKAVREMGMEIPISVPEWSDDFQVIAGETSRNVFVSVEEFNPESTDPMVQKFVKDYTDKFKETPDFYAANYYDAVNIVAELIKRVVDAGGDPMDGAALEKAIWDNPKFKTIFGGELILNKDGTVKKQLALYEVSGGKLVFIENVTE